jgi:WD40 repeat protein
LGALLAPNDTGSNLRMSRPFDCGTSPQQKNCQFIEQVTDVRSVRFSPNGKYLAAAGSECLMWDLESGAVAQKFDVAAAFQDCNALDISADGKYLATGSGCQEIGQGVQNCFVRLWSLEDGEELRRWKCPGPVLSVAFATTEEDLLIVAGAARGGLRVERAEREQGTENPRPKAQIFIHQPFGMIALEARNHPNSSFRNRV